MRHPAKLYNILAAINKECFKWDYNPFQNQPRKAFHKKAVLKNFAIFTGKHLCSLESLFNKVAELKPCNFIQNRPQHRFLLWIFKLWKLWNFKRAPILKNICEPLLLPFSTQYFKALQKIHSKTKVTQQIWKYFARCVSYEKKSLKFVIMYFHVFMGKLVLQICAEQLLSKWNSK